MNTNAYTTDRRKKLPRNRLVIQQGKVDILNGQAPAHVIRRTCRAIGVGV